MHHIAEKIKQIAVNLRISIARRALIRHHEKMSVHKAKRDAANETFMRLVRSRANCGEGA